MRDDFQRAKFWEFSLLMLFVAASTVLIISACAMREAMIEAFQSAVVFNSTSVILAALLVGHWYFGGKAWAMQLLPVSENEYFGWKAKARRSCIRLGVIVTVSVAVGTFISAMNSGMEKFLSDLHWWAVPGFVFLSISFFLYEPLWRVYWLKRLGKVKLAK